ncbi:hypothetical protein Tco_0927823 [Tanacetum coccineum]
MTLAASTSTDKSLKDFDEMMNTPIDFSRYILNALKIKNLTQEILLGPAFRLLKGTRSNYAELEYDFEECYKALSEKLDWENPKGGDYPFNLSKPLPLIMRGKHQRVPFEYFSTMISITHVKVMRKHGYGYLEEIVVRRADNILYRFRHYQEYQHGVLAEEKMEHIGKEKSSFHDQRHQQAAKGKEDDDEFVKLLADRHYKLTSDCCKEQYDFVILCSYLKGSVFKSHYPAEPEGSTQGYPLVSVEVLRFDSSAGNPVKEILLKLNLPDHKSILTDSRVTPTNHGRMTKPYSSPRFIANCFNAGYLKMEVKYMFQDFRYSDTVRSLPRSDEVLKLKKFKKDALLKLFKIIKSRKVFKITFLNNSSQDKATCSHLKSMITTSNHKLMIEVKDYELKTKVKAYNVIPDSPDMCDNEIQTNQNVVKCDDEHVALANLIANLKLDVHENKKIQKQLKKANTIIYRWATIHVQSLPRCFGHLPYRADIVDKVFEMKSKQFIKYLRNVQPFGRGRTVADCHLLLAYPSAPYMQNSTECKKHFPKDYCNRTYTDKDGFVHYQRRDTGATVLKEHVELDNRYVVPYNRDLLTTFYTHINVEYCGWTMLIKYLFKYISKGTDRIAAGISKTKTNAEESTSRP